MTKRKTGLIAAATLAACSLGAAAVAAPPQQPDAAAMVADTSRPEADRQLDA